MPERKKNSGVKKKATASKKKKTATKKTNTSAQDRKVKKVMEEYSSGKLKSSSGKKVKDREQALAIAFSEARDRADKK